MGTREIHIYKVKAFEKHTHGEITEKCWPRTCRNHSHQTAHRLKSQWMDEAKQRQELRMRSFVVTGSRACQLGELNGWGKFSALEGVFVWEGWWTSTATLPRAVTHSKCCCLPGCLSESSAPAKQRHQDQQRVPVQNVTIWFSQKVRWNDLMVFPGLQFSDSHRKRLPEHRRRTQCCVSPLLACAVQISVLHLRKKKKSALQHQGLPANAGGWTLKTWGKYCRTYWNYRIFPFKRSLLKGFYLLKKINKCNCKTSLHI